MLKVDAKNKTIKAYGVVGAEYEGGITAEGMIEALDELSGQDITLHLQSEGGNVSEGMSIYNQLKGHDGSVNVVIDSLSASIATVIMSAGATITANANAVLMIHNAWAVAFGNATNMRAVAEVLDLMDGQIADIYAQRSGTGREFWLNEMARETYYTASQAADIGLIDGVLDAEGDVPQGKLHAVASAGSFPRRKTLAAMIKAHHLKLDAYGIRAKK